MALFSSVTATANLTKVNKKPIEAPNKGREFRNYNTYSAFMILHGKTPRPRYNWYGLDGYWLESERKNSWRGWRNAVNYITLHQNPENGDLPWLQPFGQILAYYKQVYSFIKQKGHESRWLNGAYYLVEDLFEAYEEGLQLGTVAGWFSEDLRPILKELNREIAKFAITQFHKLLFGEYKNSLRKGEDAYVFDRDFIITEQKVIAFGVYPKYSRDILTQMSLVFNRSGWIAGFKSFDPTGISIPVFPGYYQSNLAEVSERYGQDARIQVPLGMLYPDQYFPGDNRRFVVDAETLGEYFNPAFRAALIKGLKNVDAYYIIYKSYKIVNNIAMKIFDK